MHTSESQMPCKWIEIDGKHFSIYKLPSDAHHIHQTWDTAERVSIKKNNFQLTFLVVVDAKALLFFYYVWIWHFE